MKKNIVIIIGVMLVAIGLVTTPHFLQGGILVLSVGFIVGFAGLLWKFLYDHDHVIIENYSGLKEATLRLYSKSNPGTKYEVQLYEHNNKVIVLKAYLNSIREVYSEPESVFKLEETIDDNKNVILVYKLIPNEGSMPCFLGIYTKKVSGFSVNIPARNVEVADRVVIIYPSDYKDFKKSVFETTPFLKDVMVEKTPTIKHIVMRNGTMMLETLQKFVYDYSSIELLSFRKYSYKNITNDLADILEAISVDIATNKAILLVKGGFGLGKSSFVEYLCTYLSSIDNVVLIKIDKNFFDTYNQRIIKVMSESSKYIFICDEADDYFNKYNEVLVKLLDSDLKNFNCSFIFIGNELQVKTTGLKSRMQQANTLLFPLLTSAEKNVLKDKYNLPGLPNDLRTYPMITDKNN